MAKLSYENKKEMIRFYKDEIISYYISATPNCVQIANTLNKAFFRFEDLTALIFHSD